MSIKQLIEEAFLYGFDIGQVEQEKDEETIDYILKKHQEAVSRKSEAKYFEWLSKKIKAGKGFDIPKKELPKKLATSTSIVSKSIRSTKYTKSKELEDYIPVICVVVMIIGIVLPVINYLF